MCLGHVFTAVYTEGTLGVAKEGSRRAHVSMWAWFWVVWVWFAGNVVEIRSFMLFNMVP